jgi:hypothetical protein
MRKLEKPQTRQDGAISSSSQECKRHEFGEKAENDHLRLGSYGETKQLQGKR